MSAPRVDELVLEDATGVWVIRSTSDTVYFIDADSSLLLRRTGPNSPPGFADNRWAPLIEVQSIFAGDRGVIRVGDRHRYLYDYDADGLDYGWWIQRLVTEIAYVEGEELARLPRFPQDGAL
ncbi:hypothetical protein MHY85_10465 [Cellulomonas sp. ACRRI]|uniref:hypothetical protein n=1 Tax=Cellulomonas sp. ACRRI TaxID=2918188 RepID=UPI001EF2E791|nr:hypothetical protein [Cellulomonas sp. ACRRI]MCG7286391.1 hypothetical protein [Cellulomonas sp. ACRRI]